MVRKHCGFWLKDSFYAIQGKDYHKGLFLGIHKPRNYKNVKNEPIEVDFQPKASITILDGTSDFEAILFPSKEITKFVAGISVLCPKLDLFNSARFEAGHRFENPEVESTSEYYVVRDLHTMTLARVLEAARETKRFYDLGAIPSVDKRPNDILWLKHAYIYVERQLHGVDAYVKQLLLIGKDIRYDMIVIGIKKYWAGKVFSTIIPLVSDDVIVDFITNIFFMVYHKPRGAPFETRDAFERQLAEHRVSLSANLGYAKFDIRSESMENIIKALKK